MIDMIYDMDTGEYETNALVINNISSVNFAFYDPVSPTLASFGSNALELENGLRRDGFLAYFDTVRRGVWCFQLSQKDRQPTAPAFPKSVGSTGFTFSLTEEGILESAALAKNRQYGPNAGNTPASSSSSSGSAGFDSAYRSAQSATLPSVQPFPTQGEQESKMISSIDSKLTSSTPTKDVYEHFILAALSAISSSFCATTGAIPLSSRTLLLPKSSHNDCIDTPAILASLRIYLTTTGSLVISFALSPAEGIINLSENLGHALPSLGVTVLAAPLGMFATCHPIANSDTSATESGFAQSPDTQVMRLRSERDDGPWRNLCAKFLSARNIPSSFCESQNWIGLQRMRRKPTEQNIDGKRTPLIGAPSISWPVNLCFCKIFSRLSIGGETEDQSASHPDRNFDPLKVAKQWVLDTGEREENMTKNKKEREAALAREVPLADGQTQHTSGLSPLTLQRPSNNAANPLPGGLYPTPPGAQNIIGATPSMDGTGSSPGNNVNVTAMTDIDTTRNLAYGDNWENPEAKRERIGASFESENLFGELGPDMFGDADITEADFNFFDEQPGDMGLGSLDLPGLSNTDANIELAVSLPSTQESQIKTGPPDIHLPDATPSPTFTKPELRHARSSLEDSRRLNGLESNKFSAASLKRPASPFNPDTVYKRIRASLDNHKAVQKNSRIKASGYSSIFDKVNFGPCLSLVNSKYEGSGRFEYSLEQSGDAKAPSLNEPPTTDYLRRHIKGRKGLKEQPGKVGQLLIRASGAQAPASNGASPSNIPSNMEEAHSDADEMSLVSDQDDSSYDGDEPLSPIKSISMRRRFVDDDGESLATSFRELESVDVSSPHEFPQTCKSEADLPLTKYFADPEPPILQYSLPDDQFIIAAQILTDQFATSTRLANATSRPLGSKVDRRRQITGLTRRSIQDIKSSLPPCLSIATECQFRSFIELQDVPLLGQPTRMQPRPPNADQMRPSNLFQIPSPHFELRRYESKLSVLPAAVAFWESLGLSPSPGNKDINAICIFPDHEGLSDDMLVFTDRMRSIYESLKLGSFNRLPTVSGIENGLFPFAAEKDPVPFNKSSPFLRPSLTNCASKVCQALASMNVEEINFVIFFVYSPDATGSIVESCAVFNQIFENYRRLLSTKKLPVFNDLALQLVPQDFVASANSVAMPSPFEFCKLAMETYDRCIQFGSTAPSPALMLEQPPPRMIDFKLTTNPSASLLHENACLHIAYAQSIDGRWITAAWTDNRGNQQMTASYCLGRKGKNLSRPIAEVASGIWMATLDFISAWKVHWRVIIAKCGAMEQSEIELWSSFAQTEQKISLTLVSVDTDPSMQLLPPIVKVSSSSLSVFYTTPVSTPQGSMVSPEQSGNPPTPIRENMGASAPTPGADNNPESDGDATLTEITDQTWGAVLSHRLNNSSSLIELNPALVSGYLIKRGGSRVEDPLVVMEVSIVHNEGNPRAYESLLREMLTYYRGLGTLARARGMVDKETDIRPWHIAAAEKAVKALYMLM